MTKIQYSINCEVEGNYDFYKNDENTGKLKIGTLAWRVAYQILKENASLGLNEVIEFMKENNIQYKEQIYDIRYCLIPHFWAGNYILELLDETDVIFLKLKFGDYLSFSE